MAPRGKCFLPYNPWDSTPIPLSCRPSARAIPCWAVRLTERLLFPLFGSSFASKILDQRIISESILSFSSSCTCTPPDFWRAEGAVSDASEARAMTVRHPIVGSEHVWRSVLTLGVSGAAEALHVLSICT